MLGKLFHYICQHFDGDKDEPILVEDTQPDYKIFNHEQIIIIITIIIIIIKTLFNIYN